MMTGFEFAPLTFVGACFAFSYYMRAKRAERRAAGWEDVAKKQEIAMDNLRGALKTQGEALDNLLNAVRGTPLKENKQ
jgi:hypothetical protein